MPSPFPGMDPYLEGARWMTVHAQLTAEIARQLAPKLRPKYVALTTERSYSEDGIRVPHRTVEIRAVPDRKLVTAIEVLSPTTKRGEGRVEYLAKRRRMLVSPAHLLEIDVLRSGERMPMGQPLPESPYYVVLSRSRRRPASEVWPVSLRGPLPVIPVPLWPNAADVPLDLQTAFASIYDALGFDLLVDYTRPADVPLSGDDAAWAASLIGK